MAEEAKELEYWHGFWLIVCDFIILRRLLSKLNHHYPKGVWHHLTYAIAIVIFAALFNLFKVELSIKLINIGSFLPSYVFIYTKAFLKCVCYLSSIVQLMTLFTSLLSFPSGVLTFDAFCGAFFIHPKTKSILYFANLGNALVCFTSMIQPSFMPIESYRRLKFSVKQLAFTCLSHPSSENISEICFLLFSQIDWIGHTMHLYKFTHSESQNTKRFHAKHMKQHGTLDFSRLFSTHMSRTKWFEMNRNESLWYFHLQLISMHFDSYESRWVEMSPSVPSVFATPMTRNMFSALKIQNHPKPKTINQCSTWPSNSDQWWANVSSTCALSASAPLHLWSSVQSSFLEAPWACCNDRSPQEVLRMCRRQTELAHDPWSGDDCERLFFSSPHCETSFLNHWQLRAHRPVPQSHHGALCPA